MRLLAAMFSIFVAFSVCSAAEIPEIEKAILSGDFEESKVLAQEFCRHAGPENESFQQATYFLALSHLRLQEFSQAARIFRELLREDTGRDLRDKTYLGLFDTYYQQAKYKKAAKTITKLLDVSRKSNYLSLIYLKAARVNIKLSRWKEAKEYLQTIMERFPNSFEYYTAQQLLEEEQYFAVQVGAFMERDRAFEVVDALQQQEHYAYIVETMDRDQRKFYRVRVGQLTVLRQAERLRKQLSKLGYPTRIYP